MTLKDIVGSSARDLMWRQTRFFSLVVLFFVCAAGNFGFAQNNKFETLTDDIYFSLIKLQSSDVIADEKDRYCQSAAQAFGAMALIERGHFNRARRILDFFENIRRSDATSEEGFKGFADFYDIKSARSYISSEIGISSESPKNITNVSPFADASIVVAVLNYRLATKDKRFDTLIYSLADDYLKNLNIWGLYQKNDIPDDTDAKLANNLAAYTVFCCAAILEKIQRQEKNLWVRLRSVFVDKDDNRLKPTDKEVEYLEALKRLKTALFEMFYDEKRKVFRQDWKDGAPAAKEAGNFFALLVFGKNSFPYEIAGYDLNTPIEQIIRNNGILKSCFATMLSSSAGERNIRDTISDYIGGLISEDGKSSQIFIIKRRPDDKFFFIDKNAPPFTYDIMATSVYLLALQNKNPFDVISSAFEKETGMIGEEFSSVKIERGEKWKGDTFENGEEAFYVIETSLIKNAEIPSPPVGIFADEKIKKEGNFSLKFRLITKQSSGGDKSQGAVSRVFYPEQDFLSTGNISSVKCWISARPATFTLGVTNLRIRLRLTDSAGISADSKNLNYSGRGVENTTAFPSGFTPTSALKVPDYTRIKRMSFILEEDTQTTWDINVDNLRAE